MSDGKAHDPVSHLMNRISALELELAAEIAKERAGLRLGLEQGRIAFEQEVLRRHRELKTRLSRYVLNARPLVVLTAPLIYSLIVPLLILDISVSIYQAICFPAYGIEKVRRREHFVFDRAHLVYLNALERLNCAYCSYANGLIGYVREIAGRTEQYWCPIKHARRMISAHDQYRLFVDYGDAEAYRERIAALSQPPLATPPKG